MSATADCRTDRMDRVERAERRLAELGRKAEQRGGRTHGSGMDSAGNGKKDGAKNSTKWNGQDHWSGMDIGILYRWEGSFPSLSWDRQSGGFEACKISNVTEQWQRRNVRTAGDQTSSVSGYRNTGQKGNGAILSWNSGMAVTCGKCWTGGADCHGHAAWIADQIAEGIQYLHERPHPFLYRDLKPENIASAWMAEQGFWIWDVCGTGSKDWSGAGNYSYSAPVPTGELPGEESDVYAMGKTAGGHAGR